MRERSTWNRDQIVRTATTGKRAEDPRAMNQDHLKQQPAADAYVTGGPSEFGEDVHPSAGTWKAEYSGGEVSRNEIGMPEIRKDTFNHPEKTAAMDDEAVLKKADLCTKVARSMLKNASEAQVEEQALALMHIPDAALVETANRLAAAVANDDEEEQGQEQGQDKQAKDAQQDEKKQGQGQNQDDKKSKAMAQEQQGKQSEQDEKKQGKDAGQVPPQFLENIKKKKDEAKDDDKGDDKKDQGKNKQASAGDRFVAALKSGNGEGVESALQAMIAQAFQQMGQGQQGQGQQQPMAQSQEQGAAYAQQQGQQQPMAQGQQGQGQQQPMAQGQNGQQQQQAQGQPQQGQQQQQAQGMPQMSDDQLLDQMLQDEMGQGQQPMMMAADGPEIQLEANTMDVGEVSLDAQDEVLSTLFASNAEYQHAAEAHALQNGGVRPAVNASQPMARTAATRTVGTRPTAGVSQIGGGGVAGNPGGNEVDKLSGLWASAPDVSGVFR